MLFRIEDTDRARHSEDAVLAIINGLKWLEIDWDGEVVSQYEQRGRHAEIAKQMLAAGHAYKCYCSPQELDEMREQAKKDGKPTSTTAAGATKRCRRAPRHQTVIRIKAPLAGEAILNDRVQGDVRVAARAARRFHPPAPPTARPRICSRLSSMTTTWASLTSSAATTT